MYIIINMTKQKKKRNKKYTGIDSSIKKSSTVRISAVNRSKTSQWINDHRTAIRFVGGIVLVFIIIVLVISGIISLF